MVSFKNDYSEGVHPKILEKLIENNLEQSDGYGEDRFTLKAISLIKKHLYNENVDIHFISGGTLTNLIAISSFLKPHQAVISPKTGHIYVHETGAIESTGHKVIPVDCPNGKINIEQIETQQKEHHFEHMVKPGLVYISQPTELGTIYSKDELNIIYSYCKSNNLLLYIDGARLASAITSKNSTITL
ncbi:MAG: aminotransferase class I/II-fold pyridoxal phosphate-dependent enzyme, partial [Spirochaetales bacterium]|nr:aminotransferase class I/II-fold pyridoxal phosphate-dependent enzyme [Spirochaetales bacterium]